MKRKPPAFLVTFLLSLIWFSLPHHKLFAQIETGYLKLDINIDSVHVIVNKQLESIRKFANGDSIELEAVRNHIILSTPFTQNIERYISIPENETHILHYEFKRKKISGNVLEKNYAARDYLNANIIIITDEDSEIYQQDKFLGKGFAKLNSEERFTKIEIRNPDFGSSRLALSSNNYQVNFVEAYKRPNKTTARFFSIVPGMSQVYKKQHLKAFLVGTSSVTLFTFAGVKSSSYHKELDVFYEYQEDYNDATTEQEALRLGNIAENQRDLVAKIDNQRKFLFLSGLLVYAYNIYDGLTSNPKGGYAKRDKDLEFYLSQEQISGTSNPSGTLRYNF